LAKWLYGVAAAIVLSPAIAKAQEAADCLADEPGVARQSRAPERALSSAATTDSLEFARRLNEAGDDALEHGDPIAAEGYHRHALQIREKLAPRSLLVAETLNALGDVATERADLARAWKYFERALSLGRALSPRSREVARSLIGLGTAARRLTDVAVEEASFQQALALRDQLKPADLADIFEGLGSACLQ
jgi:tetratricopeptide (TPR) repeat protein